MAGFALFSAKDIDGRQWRFAQQNKQMSCGPTSVKIAKELAQTAKSATDFHNAFFGVGGKFGECDDQRDGATVRHDCPGSFGVTDPSVVENVADAQPVTRQQLGKEPMCFGLR